MIGDIRFVLQSSLDLGNYLKGSNSGYSDIQTSERFIKVTIGAQNKGKVETANYGWDVGNIIDSEGRIFSPITNRAYYFLPKPDLCGASMKPEFALVSCVRMYEVSKKSEGVKIEVVNKLSGSPAVLMDLILL